MGGYYVIRYDIRKFITHSLSSSQLYRMPDVHKFIILYLQTILVLYLQNIPAFRDYQIIIFMCPEFQRVKNGSTQGPTKILGARPPSPVGPFPCRHACARTHQPMSSRFRCPSGERSILYSTYIRLHINQCKMCCNSSVNYFCVVQQSQTHMEK